MEIIWEFTAPGPLLGYCKLIAAEMVKEFAIPYEEAVGRINASWAEMEFSNVSPDDLNLIYHELPSHWAKRIYYGEDSFWWIRSETERDRLGLLPLQPVRWP